MKLDFVAFTTPPHQNAESLKQHVTCTLPYCILYVLPEWLALTALFQTDLFACVKPTHRLYNEQVLQGWTCSHVYSLIMGYIKNRSKSRERSESRFGRTRWHCLCFRVVKAHQRAKIFNQLLLTVEESDDGQNRSRNKMEDKETTAAGTKKTNGAKRRRITFEINDTLRCSLSDCAAEY
ncbi:hypothetical protein M513_01340 [Trichuris suis]|uniref:Uncharacterized protein n=1 Tax=Trichuris suis TaxID=68888 RepID=A0A085MKC4_9BILA|nr:hypothetical protein M513_01340 [Trichuris suis]